MPRLAWLTERGMHENKENEQSGEHAQDERMFRLLVQGVTDYGIYMLDPGGRIVNWNAGAERIKGYSSREAVGQHFSIFYPPEDQAAGLPQMALEAAHRDGHFMVDGWRVRKDGSRFFASRILPRTKKSSCARLSKYICCISYK